MHFGTAKSLIGALVFANVFSMGSSSFAQKLEATYEGDPFYSNYASIAETIFADYRSANCSVRRVIWSDEAIEKFKSKNNVPVDAAVFRGGCDLPAGTCITEDGEEICFENPGQAWMGSVRLRNKGARAIVSWNSLFLNASGDDQEGVILQEYELKKENGSWWISRRTHKMVMDFRD